MKTKRIRYNPTAITFTVNVKTIGGTATQTFHGKTPDQILPLATDFFEFVSNNCKQAGNEFSGDMPVSMNIVFSDGYAHKLGLQVK